MKRNEIFRQMLAEFLEELKQLPHERLAWGNEPPRHVVVDGREGVLHAFLESDIPVDRNPPDPLSILVRPERVSVRDSGTIKVVVQGKGKGLFAVGGFWKHPDDSVTECAPKELYDYY